MAKGTVCHVSRSTPDPYSDPSGTIPPVKRLTVMAVLLLAGCATAGASPTTTSPQATSAVTTTSAGAATTTSTTTTLPATTTTASPFARPEWLGTRVLPLGPDGENGIAQPTPPELQDRQLETIDLLPPPPDDEFVATIEPVPDDVIARSTWTEDCPVTRDELAYINVSFYGFDGKFHTGETIVNASVADDIVGVFEKLHAARFPIEGMKVTTQEELDAPPTGDGNNTGSFGCRPAVGTDNWSMHAYGLAVDINPFHNPYEKGELIIPELAMSYLDRDQELPGMIHRGRRRRCGVRRYRLGLGRRLAQPQGLHAFQPERALRVARPRDRLALRIR